MRSNEVIEEIAIVTILMVTVPVAFVLLLCFGGLVLLGSPIIIPVIVITGILWLKGKDKARVKKGKIKLLVLPKPVKFIFGVIFQIIVVILVLALIIFLLSIMPFGLACFLLLCLIGYGVGVGVSKMGGE